MVRTLSAAVLAALLTVATGPADAATTTWTWTWSTASRPVFGTSLTSPNFTSPKPAGASPGSATSPGTTTGTATVAASLQAALNRINSLRAQAGAGPLVFNAALNRAAQAFAEDMAAHNYFSHTGRDGSTPGQRLTAAGYDWSTYGENIAQGYADWNAAITGWMNSPGHRANMLNPNFREIGLGVKNRYYVQDFGARR